MLARLIFFFDILSSFLHFAPRLTLICCVQLPEAQELHRLVYVDFAHALLRLRDEGRHKLLSFPRARKVAKKCGFVGKDECVGALRVMEKVTLLFLFFTPFANVIFDETRLFAVDDHVQADELCARHGGVGRGVALPASLPPASSGSQLVAGPGHAE